MGRGARRKGEKKKPFTLRVAVLNSRTSETHTSPSHHPPAEEALENLKKINKLMYFSSSLIPIPHVWVVLYACWGRLGQLMPKLHSFCPFHVNGMRRKKGRRNANGRRRKMVEASHFCHFLRAFWAVRLCQENVYKGRRCQRNWLYFFHFSPATPLPLFCLVLWGLLLYLFLFPKHSLCFWWLLIGWKLR